MFFLDFNKSNSFIYSLTSSKSTATMLSSSENSAQASASLLQKYELICFIVLLTSSRLEETASLSGLSLYPLGADILPDLNEDKCITISSQFADNNLLPNSFKNTRSFSNSSIVFSLSFWSSSRSLMEFSVRLTAWFTAGTE